MWLRHAMLPMLQGRWSLDRTIEDLNYGQPMAAMQGEAIFTPSLPGEASYEELVTLALADGTTMPASRGYFYRQEVDGLSIFFDEEHSSLFHRLVLESQGGGLLGIDLHHCAPDHYDSRYAFHGDGGFAVTHVVRGPRKSYVSRTFYRRAI